LKDAQHLAKFITKSVSNVVFAKKELMESFLRKMANLIAPKIMRLTNN